MSYVRLISFGHLLDLASQTIYIIRYKPGSTLSGPIKDPFFPLLHMPRLDWLLWFLALQPDSIKTRKWFIKFLVGILERKRGILDLLDSSSPALKTRNQIKNCARNPVVRVSLERVCFSAQDADIFCGSDRRVIFHASLNELNAQVEEMEKVAREKEKVADEKFAAEVIQAFISSERRTDKPKKD